MPRSRLPIVLPAVATVVAVLYLGAAGPAEAIPYFARQYDVGCQTCHSVVPKLNETGLSFRARGYRLPATLQRESNPTIPVAVWLGARYENRTSADADSAFVDKVEVISGGQIVDRLSYFVEWRTVSFGLNDDESLSDRSGRFEDAFVTLDLTGGLGLTVGQFRLFNQFDNSLKLSASDPVAIGSGVPGERASTGRLTGLRGFSPASRSPAVMLTWHRADSRPGASAADGWYVHGSVPFPGELSLPLSDEARDRASFELELEPKGVYLESYYRRGLSSFGGAAFLDDGRQLYTGLASFDPGPWNSTVALSAGVVDGDADRRLSWWNEVQPIDGVALGARVDDTSFGPASLSLYGDFQWYLGKSVLWLLVEQRLRDDDNRTIFQINSVF